MELTSLSDSSMVITWSTTNESASTEILWGSGGLTNIATGPATTSTTAMSGATKFHSIELKGLYQNTTYQYRIKSGDTVFPPAPWFSPLSFKTLEKPSGEYLFSFAVLNDLRYVDTEEKADVPGARGIPFSKCPQIITSEVADINNHDVAFTVINGNIADYDENAATRVTYNNQIKTSLKKKLEDLSGASDLPYAAHKYLPVPGFHDKKATYTTAADDWLSDNMLPLTTDSGSAESRYTSLYGYNAASKDADSVFNYQFEYKNYNFIFLDSVKDNGSGNADLNFLYNKLFNSGKKTFVFMNFPGYNPFDADTKDYPLSIPTAEVGGVLTIDNHGAFRATLESFKDDAGNPVVAAVISAHLGDNYKRDIELVSDPTKSISYVRQGPALQYPVGYSIYKVYSTGYVKTFYKTKGRDTNDKPYYEHARDQIVSTTESGQNIAGEALVRFWLGSSSSRNFTYQYAFIPGVAPKVISTAPASNESAVGLNSPILVTFNKRLSAASDLIDWVTIKDSNNDEALTVSNVSFLDSSRTILQVTHADFTVGKIYTVTVSGSKVKDEGSTFMGPDYRFSFNTTGGKKDESPPLASINPLPDNSTTDPFPNFIGIATDESRVITVQYRFDNTGAWITTEAVDGQFTGSVEAFQIKPSSPLSVGSHQIWLRTSDGAGNTSAEGFMAYPFTVIVGDKPSTTSFKISGNAVKSGDPISSTPKIEIILVSNNVIASAKITIDSTSSTIPLASAADSIFSASSLVKVDNNYYLTYEVSSVLTDGIHGITVEAFDVLGNAATYEVYPLYVQSVQNVTAQGAPLCYPNPFDPGTGTQTTAISYSLSKAADVTLNIFDLAGNLIVKKSYTTTQDGGKAGYNEVSWDGKSDSGAYVGTGIYIYLIIADGRVVQNGKGKITVFKR